MNMAEKPRVITSTTFEPDVARHFCTLETNNLIALTRPSYSDPVAVAILHCAWLEGCYSIVSDNNVNRSVFSPSLVHININRRG